MVVVVAVVRTLGAGEVTLGPGLATGRRMSSSPTPLHSGVVQIHAEMESDSSEEATHELAASTGLSMLPSRMLVGKHSLMTEVSVADFLQE